MDELIKLQSKALLCFYGYINYWYPDLDDDDFETFFHIPQIVPVSNLKYDNICMYINEEELNKKIERGSFRLENGFKLDTNDCILLSIKDASENGILTLISLVKEYMKANTTFVVDDFEYFADLDSFRLTPQHKMFKKKDNNYFHDILKGSVDLNETSINRTNKIDIEQDTNKYLYIQKRIYETILFMAAYCSIQISIDEKLCIRKILEDYLETDTNPKSEANYIISLLLKKNNLEVFKSIINPIDYTLGDMHYDYFLNSFNTKERKKLFKFYK